MIELMRNTQTKRRKAKLTRDVIRRIDANMPSKRGGRMVYYKSICDSLGVTVAAIYRARTRYGV
jgi:hypothetical protein